MNSRNLLILQLLIILSTFSIIFTKDAPKPESRKVKGIEVDVINNVIQLDPLVFNPLVEANDLSLIKFYAPSCSHCTKMAPAFAQLAKEFAQDEQVLIAEINTSTYDKFTDGFKIFHIPTLYLFHKETKIIEYKGNMTTKEMSAYINKMKPLLLKPITSIAQIEEIKSTFEAALIYFGDNEEDIKTFNKDIIFFSMRNICSDIKVMQHYNIQPRTIVLFKQYDDKRNDFVIKEKLDDLEASQFALNNARIRVHPMSYEIYLEVFAYSKQAIIMFYNGKDKKEKIEEYQKLFLELATTVLSEMEDDETKPPYFTTVDVTKEGTEKTIAKEANLTIKSKLPLMKIIDSVNKKNFAYSGAFTVKGMSEFIKKWRKGELVPIQFEDL